MTMLNLFGLSLAAFFCAAGALLLSFLVLATVRHTVQIIRNRKWEERQAQILMVLSDIRTWCAAEFPIVDYVAKEIYKVVDGTYCGLHTDQFRNYLRQNFKHVSQTNQVMERHNAAIGYVLNRIDDDPPESGAIYKRDWETLLNILRGENNG